MLFNLLSKWGLSQRKRTAVFGSLPLSEFVAIRPRVLLAYLFIWVVPLLGLFYKRSSGKGSQLENNKKDRPGPQEERAWFAPAIGAYAYLTTQRKRPRIGCAASRVYESGDYFTTRKNMLSGPIVIVAGLAVPTAVQLARSALCSRRPPTGVHWIVRALFCTP